MNANLLVGIDNFPFDAVTLIASALATIHLRMLLGPVRPPGRGVRPPRPRPLRPRLQSPGHASSVHGIRITAPCSRRLRATIASRVFVLAASSRADCSCEHAQLEICGPAPPSWGGYWYLQTDGGLLCRQDRRASEALSLRLSPSQSPAFSVAEQTGTPFRHPPTFWLQCPPQVTAELGHLPSPSACSDAASSASLP